MFPLIGLSFMLAFLVIERFFFYAALGKDDITPDDVLEGIRNKKETPANSTGIYSELLRRFISAQKVYDRLDRSIIDEVTRKIMPEFKKHLQSIGALTTAAPLLGLLGTVSGMVTTFNVMNIFGTGNAKAMSGGISEAMITTQFGLVVAIIGLYISMILNRRALKYETIVRELSVHIIRKFNL